MLKCPFCHFDNEDGALFCDQCKSDLSSVAPSPVPVVPVPVSAVPVVVDAIPVLAEPIDVIPLAPEPVMPNLSLGDVATPVLVEAVPVMAEAVPVMAEPVTVTPVLLEPITPAPVPVVPVPVEPVPVTPVPVVATPVAPPPPPPAPPAPVHVPPQAAPAGQLAPGAQPRLLVMRGVKRNAEYPIYEGQNFVGRSDDKPVDIDLEEQEPPDRVWCSRQHCCIFFENNELSIEDLNSSNGTFVNRVRIYPGQKTPLKEGDVVQIGNVQMKVVV